MPVFFQHQINENTRLGVWKIEESEAFFKGNVPQHRHVTHPHKRLQHLAGRFLLQFLFPDFPYEMVQIADTNKPFLPEEQYHFSISHCGDYAAAIVSRDKRVGIDVELTTNKIIKIKDKYLSQEEQHLFNTESLATDYHLLTLLWSAKESVFKWYGQGNVDFKKHIRLLNYQEGKETLDCFFSKNEAELTIHYRWYNDLVLSWIIN